MTVLETLLLMAVSNLVGVATPFVAVLLWQRFKARREN